MKIIDINEITKAKDRLKDVIYYNPLAFAPNLSKICNANVFLKKENLQLTGSFKIRGAFNKISKMKNLDEKNNTNILENGIICASAGNHAQGVAFAGHYFGIKSFVVMPEAAPMLKVVGTKNLGAEVILSGNNYDEAYAFAMQFAKENKLNFMHPFADEDIIAGQGTIALEMINEQTLDAVLVPVGGGGLISGIASAYKQLSPSTKIIGINAKGANAMTKSFKNKEIINSKSVKTIADGIAVRDVNNEIFECINNNVDFMIEVDDEEIASAILFLLESQKIVVEGAGATCVAALLHNKLENIIDLNQNTKIGCVLSGGNIDVTMLNLIIEKGLLKSDRKMKFQVILIDKPGSLKKLTEILTKEQANIVYISYNRVSTKLAYGDANVIVEIELKGKKHKESVCKILSENDYSFFEIP